MKIFGYSEFRKIIVNNFKIQKYEKGGIVVLLYVFLCVPVCPDDFRDITLTQALEQAKKEDKNWFSWIVTRRGAPLANIWRTKCSRKKN